MNDIIEYKLKKINDPGYREKIKGFLKICSYCGKSYLSMVITSLAGQKTGCTVCCSDLEAAKTEFGQFWELISGKKEELSILSKNPHLQIGLDRIIKIIYKWGLNYPLIIPYTVKWESTNLCNLKCIHCITNSGTCVGEELSKQEVFGLIDECVRIGVINFGIVGGEPLLRKDLFEIINYAVSKGLRVSLSTNATLVNESIAKKIADSSIEFVAVSVDGIGKVHDEFRGIPGVFDKTIFGIKCLIAKGIKVHVTTVASKHNINCIGKIIDYLSEVGVYSYTVNELLPSGRGKQHKNLCLSDEDYAALKEILDIEREEKKGKLLIRWVGVGNQQDWKETDDGLLLMSKCGAGLTELTVKSDGGVKPCPFLPSINENIRKTSLEDIWFSSKYLERYRDKKALTGKCNGCKFQFSCGGGCRARAEGLSGYENAPDLRCKI